MLVFLVGQSYKSDIFTSGVVKLTQDFHSIAAANISFIVLASSLVSVRTKPLPAGKDDLISSASYPKPAMNMQ